MNVWSERLYDVAFLILAIAFGVIAAMLDVPKGYFIIGILGMGSVYVFIGWKYIDKMEEFSSPERLEATDEAVSYTSTYGKKNGCHGTACGGWHSSGGNRCFRTPGWGTI